ncbi:TonB-dependent siderophore receptor [Paraburkholderia acidisoli]|uniref:TonB-dependent siderophore receptor n=1 Tax=Paraburkholderia acidisoli TaxID=2571748 RepID=A0A7Z2GNT0_9BURK|nr:TonB-dependent siderophore receptor [Paraburkholderia acidisoli]QGZ65143.1 TonB-dependent siderophore receptor [Paraburkholderia acidisoli]
MRTHQRLTTLHRAAMLVWLAAAAGAHAQTTASGTTAADAATGTGATLAPVAVTAPREDTSGVDGYVAKRSVAGAKTDTPVTEIPQSVSTVTRDQMDAYAAQTVDAAIRYVPGVVSQDNDLRFDQVTSRGFNLGDDSYLDGMRLLRTTWYATPRIDPYFLDRIDVVRGPVSVLYGQSSPGGALLMTSKLPTAYPFHEVQMQIGSDNRYQGMFDLSGPVDQNGTILYRVTGLARDADSQTDHVKEQRLAIAPSVTFRPDRNTTFTLLGSYQYDPQGGLFNPVPAAGTVLPNINGTISSHDYLGNPATDRFKRTQLTLGYLFEHAFSDAWKFRQNARYLHQDIQFYQNSIFGSLADDQRTAGLYTNNNDEHLANYTLDNQLEGKFDTGALNHTVLFGFDVQRVTNRISRGYGLGTIDIFAPDYSAIPYVVDTTKEYIGQTDLGLYAQDQIRYGGWTLTLGGRQDWAYNTDTTDGVQTRSHQHAFTWRAGLSYEFQTGIAPYASFAKSFQPYAGSTFDGTPFQPTRGKQYEVGVKYQPKGYNALFTLAAFDLRQTNVETLDDDHPGFTKQTGEIRSRGFEAEARMGLAEGLNVIASYAYLNQTVISAAADDPSLGKTPPTGEPVNMASLWLDYTLQRGGLRGLGFGGGVRYIGASAGDDANTFKVPSHFLVDATVHYDVRNWRFAINANNIFNRQYIAYCNSSTQCYYGSDRSVIGTARYQW